MIEGFDNQPETVTDLQTFSIGKRQQGIAPRRMNKVLLNRN